MRGTSFVRGSGDGGVYHARGGGGTPAWRAAFWFAPVFRPHYNGWAFFRPRRVRGSPEETSMNNVIDCPSCTHKLRLPDDLLGQQVECPTCGATFPAPADGEQPPPR